MSFSGNLQYLRRRRDNMTQEKLAQLLGVSRQTVSKWESGESTPELSKLMELCDIFCCTMDALLREDLALRDSVSLPVRIVQICPFRYAARTVISCSPEEDSRVCLERWAELNGLDPRESVSIGWGFPHLSREQKQRFGLRGYVSALVLPEGFEPGIPGAELVRQEAAFYAVTSIPAPVSDTSSEIARAYETIFEYLSTNGIPKLHKNGILPSFRRVYRQGGRAYMDVYIHCQDTAKAYTVTELK